MGSRDFRKPEKKKPRKDEKKIIAPTTILSTPVEVEVIKKGKKERPEEE